MMRKLLPILVLAFCSSIAVAQEDWKEVRSKANKHLKNPEAYVRLDMVRSLEDHDRKESVDILLKYWALSSKLIWTYRADMDEKTEKRNKMPIRKKLQQGGRITLTGDEVQQKKDYDELGQEIVDLEKKINDESKIHWAIRKALSGFSEADSVKVIRKKLKSEKDPSARGAAAEALGAIRDKDSAEDLRKTLKKEKDPRVVMAIIDALRMVGDKSAIPDIAAAMQKSDSWQVKVSGVQALRAFGDPACVEPLIEALNGADGRVKDDINNALVSLTGVDKHGDYLTWKDWYATNKDSLLGGSYKRPANSGKGKAAKTTFYGIPVVSKRLVFILDRSGSMAEPAEWKPGTETPTGPGSGGAKPEKVGDRKIDVAKYELKKAIRALPEDAHFNVIFYNHEFTIWQDSGVLPANKANKSKAIKFVDSLEPSGATNIYDPTERGFQIRDKNNPRQKDPEMGAFKGGVDTIYLLSDGMPNHGKYKTAPEILTNVKSMNAKRKIVIHTIGVGKSANPGFLKSLAKQNGGTFVHRK